MLTFQWSVCILSNLVITYFFTVVGVAKKLEWFGPNGERIEPNKPDITVTRNDDSSSILTLYKAGTANAGTYKCVVTNGDQQGEASVKVKIFRKFHPNTKLMMGTKEEKTELTVFHWLLKGNTLLFFFSSEEGFFISSINGWKTIRGLLNDPVCCAVLVSNSFYFPWMPSIGKCPSEMKYVSNTNFNVFGFPL